MIETLYRANFGDGTYTRGWTDIRDAKQAIWGRAGIVQYRSFIETITVDTNTGCADWDSGWRRVTPDTRGPIIVERRA